MARPRIYHSVEQLEKVIDDYFLIDEKEVTETDCGPVAVIKKVPNPKPTVTGLALHLGFADKSSLYEYRDRPEFSYSIKRALTKIEMYHEENLGSNNVAGRIFALKNMGWRDKTEVDQNHSGGVKITIEDAEGCHPLDYETKVR